MKITITITGTVELKSRLDNLARIEWDDIWDKMGREMKQKSDAIVPVDTGALRDSAVFDHGAFGYTASYAPFVNYGHRTRDGGFVPGRHFLEEVVNSQEGRYREEVLKKLRGL